MCSLEEMLENYDREGYPGEEMQGIIGKLTLKTVRDPVAIKMFIEEQRARLARSHRRSNDNNSINSTSSSSEDSYNGAYFGECSPLALAPVPPRGSREYQKE